MSEEFVYIKLVNGEQLMAIKEDETEETVLLRYPMIIKQHVVAHLNNKVTEQITAGPYSMFTDDTLLEFHKRNILVDALLSERAVNHYIELVQEHEGVNLSSELDWEDDSTEVTVEEIETAVDKLSLKLNQQLDEEETVFIQGNDTIH
jgi:hypothetical protein